MEGDTYTKTGVWFGTATEFKRFSHKRAERRRQRQRDKREDEKDLQDIHRRRDEEIMEMDDFIAEMGW